MLSGPARLDELQRSIHSLEAQLDAMQIRQDAQIADLRESVRATVDDVTARLAALDAADRP